MLCWHPYQFMLAWFKIMVNLGLCWSCMTALICASSHSAQRLIRKSMLHSVYLDWFHRKDLYNCLCFVCVIVTQLFLWFQDPEGASRDNLGPATKLQVGACWLCVFKGPFAVTPEAFCVCVWVCMCGCVWACVSSVNGLCRLSESHEQYRWIIVPYFHLYLLRLKSNEWTL